MNSQKPPKFEAPDGKTGEWKTNLLQSYVDKGYIMANIVPAPPLMSMEKDVEAGSRYDYDSVPMPDHAADDARIRADYEAAIEALALEHGGRENIRVAYPTDEMIAQEPLYGEREYHILMVPVIPIASGI